MRVDPRSFPASSGTGSDEIAFSRAPVIEDDQRLFTDPGVVLDGEGMSDKDMTMAMEWESAAGGATALEVAQGRKKTAVEIRNESSITPIVHTPKKRKPPPTSIPNFPPASSSFPNPNFSFGNTTQFQVPATPPSQPPQSPWHHLALNSGAPTPSLESGPGGSMANRSSPALGYPFERLNIGGSWSGANLFGAGAATNAASSGDDGFGFPVSAASATQSPTSENDTRFPTRGPSMTSSSRSGMSAHTISRYRSLAGKPAASAVDMAPPPLPNAKAPGGFQLNFPGSSLANRRSTVPKAEVQGAEQSQAAYPSASKASPRVSFPSPGLPAGPSVPTGRLQPIFPANVKELIGKSTTLILDLRPPSSFLPSHIPGSHSLPIPSTLLRRQTFSLQKLAQMLPQPALSSVQRYRNMSDLILIDQESHTAPEGSVLKGLSSKFEKEDYKGKLWFVKGGMAALTHRGEIAMVTGKEAVDDKAGNESENVAPLGSPGSLNPSRLMAGRLGKLAFQQGSTGSGRNQPATPGGARALSLPTSSIPFSAHSDNVPNGSNSNGSTAGTERPPHTSRRDVDMSIRGSVSPGGSALRAKQLQPANPFFDNIRQNLELSHGGITERIPLNLPEEVVKRAWDLPHWLRDLVQAPEDVSMQKLAMEFYSIELGEQKRLQGVMDWHATGSGGVMDSHYDGQALEGVSSAKRGALNARFKQERELKRLTPKGSTATGEHKEEGYFPFSITAGVERGTKNRYKNIWPYDFSRVRLASPADDDSDYINASFVQPRTTTRRYIATQGPLDSTYRDFWTLVWEQGVTVIVMLTKEYEGGLLKCGDYWSEGTYGALKLDQVSVEGVEEEKPDAAVATGFDFGFSKPTTATKSSGVSCNIKRTFLLRHTDHPSQQPRKVVQIQCVTWPDFDVPESPECLLRLIRDVDETVDEIHGTSSRMNQSRANLPPVLVHCSAGVGRTGSFIVVDTIIDALRLERQHAAREKRSVRSLRNRSSSKLLGNKTPKVKSGSETSSTSAGSFLNPFSADAPANMPVTSPGAIAPPAPSVVGVEPKADSMDVDPQGSIAIPDASPGSPFASRFTEFREGRRDSVDSTGHGFAHDSQRPRLVDRNSGESGWTSGSVTNDSEQPGSPLPVPNSHGRAREPSPINELDDPIQDVLEGMRVQRMSLCQSLRQYLFVYRVIIYYYLQLLDQEAEHENSITSDSDHTPGGLSSIISISNAGSSAVSTDDEGHVKRRASPTELQLTGSSLSKRPSFKKMRPTAGVAVLSPGEDLTKPAASPSRHHRKPSSQE